MSVYRDSNATVVFEHPFPGPLTASVYRDAVKIKEVAGLTPQANRFELALNWRDTQYDGPLTIIWEGDDGGQLFQRTTTEEVITPIVPISRLRTVFENDNPSDGDLRDLEEATRIYIQSYTGQSFGYRVGELSVTGNGEKRVALPNRLIRATSIHGGPPGYFNISNNGWYLYIGNKNWLTTKEVPPEEFDTNTTYMTKGVIHVPDQYWKQFRVGAVYYIEGEWGYYSVPDDVQQAAMILASDYACGDNVYRERYLEQMKYSDTNFTYNAGAFRGTGNVRADQLLDQYRRNAGMVVI